MIEGPSVVAGELAPTCVAALESGNAVRVAVAGAESRRIAIQTSNALADAYAIEEDGVDVFVRALDAQGGLLAIFDNPVARNGVQIVPKSLNDSLVAAFEFEGKEHKELRGHVFVRSLTFKPVAADRHCSAMLKDLSRADRDYGTAQAFKLRRLADRRVDSNALLVRSQSSYIAARKRVAGARVQDTAAVEAMLAALSYFSLDDWRQAADWASAASVNFTRVGATYGAARSKSMLAAAWLEIATLAMSSSSAYDAPQESAQLMDRARALLVELEEFFVSRGDNYHAALQTNNIGLAFYYQADFALGRPYFLRAETAFRRIAEFQRTGLAIQNIALCDWGQGRLSSAITGFQRALQFISPSSEPQLYAIAANNLGLVSYAAGQYDRAQKELSRAYAAAETYQDETFRARALYGLAVTQYALGDKSAVEQLLANVLQIWTPQLDARGRVAALRALAVVKRDQGNWRDALRSSREALSLASAPSARGRILLDIAESQTLAGDSASALEILNPIANRVGSSDRLLAALARMVRAVVLRGLGRYEAALDDLQRSLPVFRELQDVNAEFRCLLEWARVSDSQGDGPTAVLKLEQALELSDEIRNQTANPEFRASLAATLREAQELRLAIFWREFQAANARQDNVAAKEIAIRSLASVDSRRGSVLEELRGRADRGAQAKSRVSSRNSQEILRQLAELRYQLTVRYDRAGSDDKAALRLRAKIAELRASLGAESADVTLRPAALDRRLVNTEQRLRELGRVFSDHAFVEYWLGEKSAFAWVLRHDRAVWVRLDEPGPIRALVTDYSQTMSNGQVGVVAERQQLLRALHRSLLAKLIPLLDNAKELVVVADGPLALVSFGTLHDASQRSSPYLAQRFNISMAPALSLVDARSPRANAKPFEKELLLVADPVYESGDPRFRDSASDVSSAARSRSGVVLPGGRKFRRLVWSGAEADSIASLLPPERFDRLTGFSADRRELASRDLRAYRFLHFAVHATTDPEVPQLSAVILSQFDRQGRVLEPEWRSGDFANIDIQAEAVVLSACSSAAGRNIAGEGVLGLQYAALAGGARSVVATYWEVQDEISAQLMTETYRRMLSGNDSPSRAVGNAVRSLLQDQPDLDPAVWGAFATYIILPREPKMKG